MPSSEGYVSERKQGAVSVRSGTGGALVGRHVGLEWNRLRFGSEFCFRKQKESRRVGTLFMHDTKYRIRDADYTSRFFTVLAWVWMNFRRGSTSLPMRMSKSSSAASASSIVT